MEMIEPSFSAVFSLSEEMAIGFDKKLSSYIIPFVFPQGFSV
jgi:hypothetical protein